MILTTDNKITRIDEKTVSQLYEELGAECAHSIVWVKRRRILAFVGGGTDRATEPR